MSTLNLRGTHFRERIPVRVITYKRVPWWRRHLHWLKVAVAVAVVLALGAWDLAQIADGLWR